MAAKSFPRPTIAGKKRLRNARKDTPDIRDRMYEPALIQLQQEIDNRTWATNLDQVEEAPVPTDLPHRQEEKPRRV